MKISRFLGADGPRLGIQRDDGFIDLVGEAYRQNMAWTVPLFKDLRLFLAGGDRNVDLARLLEQRAEPDFEPLTETRILAPFEAGSKVFGHVVNYAGHEKEAKVSMPQAPFFFPKLASSVCGPHDTVTVKSAKKLDYEIELAVVIGRTGRDISIDDAFSYVAGVTIANDISARDWQLGEYLPNLRTQYGMNWAQGKGQDRFCPLGPTLLIIGEELSTTSFHMTSFVNGQPRQDAHTASMHWKIPDMIAQLSIGVTLYPGDIILTGSPPGGGISDGQYLQPGDVVECRIETIGALKNRVRDLSA